MAKTKGRKSLDPETEHRRLRLFGLALMAIGATLLKYFVFDVLKRAETQWTDIHYNVKVLAIAGVLPPAGLVLFLYGSRVKDWSKAAGSSVWKRMLLLLFLFVPSLGLILWFEARLRQIGYNR